MAMLGSRAFHSVALFLSNCSFAACDSGSRYFLSFSSVFWRTESAVATVKGRTLAVSNPSLSLRAGRIGAIARPRKQSGDMEPPGDGCRVICRGWDVRHGILLLSLSFRKLPLRQVCVGGYVPLLNSKGRLRFRKSWRMSSSANENVEGANGKDKKISEEREEGPHEAEGDERNVSELKGETEGVDMLRSDGGSGAGAGEEDGLEQSVVNKERAKTGFWRRPWKVGQDTEEVVLGLEEKILFQDLDNLSFSWKSLLDPTWENVVALAFTTLLILALAKIFVQLILVEGYVAVYLAVFAQAMAVQCLRLMVEYPVLLELSDLDALKKLKVSVWEYLASVDRQERAHQRRMLTTSFNDVKGVDLSNP